MKPERLLRWLILLALLPSLLALQPRLAAEQPGPVALTLDMAAVLDEARATGRDVWDLLEQYRSWGVNGLAIAEPNLRTLISLGQVNYTDGGSLKLIYPQAGFRTGWYYLQASPALIDRLASLWKLPSHRLKVDQMQWLGSPIDVAFFPAGPPQDWIDQATQMGFYVVYRPFNLEYRNLEAQLWPQGADAIAFAGIEVLGFPQQLSQVSDTLEQPIALIEGTPQEGFAALARQHPVLRLFSLRPEWQFSLKPSEAADKYLLAARERGHQILYFRPYPYQDDTRRFLQTLQRGLSSSQVAIEHPAPRNFTPSPLRWAAWLGLVAGLGLLALGYPQPIGWAVAGLVGLLALGAGRSDAGPLLAALVFPVLGFLERRKGLGIWLAATLYSLAGVVFLAALGSEPATVLGLEAFRGVSLTLVVPPALVLLSFLPQDFRPALNALWDHRIKLGEVGLALAALALLALVVLRRGNDAPAVASWEIELRALLQDLMVRPRFKELFAHALAPLALWLPWPAWIKAGLLVLIAVGEASILNTFSHYHTPLSISFFRVLNGIFIGLAAGVAAWWILRRLRKWWLG
jgi:hypothetical protein